MMELYSSIGAWVEDPGIDEFEGLDIRSLDMDQAYVVAETTLDNIRLYAVSDDCYRCPYELLHTMSREPEPWVVTTAHRVSWRLVKGASEKYIGTENSSGVVCEMRPELGEFGVYRLNLTSEACQLTTASQPVNIHLPLLLAVMVLGCLAMVAAAVSLILFRVRRKSEKLASPNRFRALDTFRGLTIVLMVFVNCGGGHYQRWMSHATWNGVNVADFVFPCFVWIMGFCIPLSTNRALTDGAPRGRLVLRAFKRSFLLFFGGVCLQTVFGDNYLGSVRVMGVLQRLALAYLPVATVHILTSSKGSPCSQALKDVWTMAGCWVLAAVSLALHTYITYRVHDPNCPPGYLGPGGRHDNWAAAGRCAGGAAGYVDRLVLGDSHVYPDLSITIIYGASSIDPENLLGSLTTVVHVVLGAQAGACLLHQRGHRGRLARWLGGAAVQAALGGALAGFSREEGLVPLNKNLWSISFVLVLSAFSGAALSACYVLTDVLRAWRGAPLAAPGRNALLLYVAHTACEQMMPFRWRVPRMRTHAIFLLENLWATALWLVVAHVLVRKKVLFKL